MATEAQPRRRRDRKIQLAVLAADLFRQRGYHAVGISDIASAAGITGAAVYRHYSNKQEILAQVLLTSVDTLADTVRRVLHPAPGDIAGTASATASAEPDRRMSALVDALARLAVERRDAVALWRWLGRHLDRERQLEVRRRGEAPMLDWAAELRRQRPALSAAESELLCLAAMGVFASPADHRVTLGKERHVQLLSGLAGAVLGCDVDAGRPDAGEDTSPKQLPSRPESGDSPLAASRRERLLAEASRLFRKRGYHAVTMEDIGAAAGIAGPSVYRHFASKSDLLRSASTRMADRLSHDAARATAGAASATESLDRLVDCYAEAIWDNRDLITVYLNELAGLPEAQRAQLRRLQRGYVTEWVRLTRAAKPGLTTAEARVVVQAALTVANDLARTGRTRGRPHLAQEIASLMRAVTRASCLPAGESGEEA